MAVAAESAAAEPAQRPPALPIVFGPAGRPLFGHYHAPLAAPDRATGVVLCNPLGHEALCVHRVYRHLAERLAARGFAALRFDYDGTGDSWGGPEDPGRVRAWQGSLDAAIAELRQRSGARRIALFGMRVGATLAALAAADHSEVDSLIAWAPALSGRAYVRELRALRMIKDPRIPAPPPRTDGAEEVLGHLFTRETLDELAAVDLLAGPTRVPRRVMLLPRGQPPVDEARYAAALQARGAEVRVAAGSVYARLMRDPYQVEVPAATLDSIVDWLAESPPREDRAAPRAVALAPQQGAPALRETPLLFGEGDRLFGVLTEPASPPPRDRPAVCLLNVGSNHHIGPHRMYVDLARDLASRGYLAFRFDIAGLGDSRAAPGLPENKLYDRRSIEDVRSAMTLLERLRGARRFVLLGVCSGAFLAYQTALVDARTAGQVLVNSFAFEWKEGDPIEYGTYGSSRYYTRALLDLGWVKRVWRGQVDVRGIAGILRERALSGAGRWLRRLASLVRGRGAGQTSVERGFGALCDRGLESLLISGFSDGGLDMIARNLGGGARSMRGRKNFNLQIFEGVDHTFTPIAARRALYKMVIEHLTARFQ